jgi:drug/metabolite transporter (DMT)-like permease
LLLGVLRLVEEVRLPKPGALLAMLGIGLVGGTLFNAALNEGMRLTSASNSALIMATAPIWGMFLAAAPGVETLKLRSLLGAGISLLGVGLILGKGLGGSASSLLGDVLVAATSFGAYSVLSR